MNNILNRTIGFHPCVGKKASGEGRPTSVVIRTADGKHAEHEFDEQQLLDFFTCGAAVSWRDAAIDDLAVERPPQHLRYAKATAAAYAQASEEEREKLFRVERDKKTGEPKSIERLQSADGLEVLNPETDIVGVANGGLGYQIMDVLLGRYPEMDVRVVGSGTLKENRKALDELLPATLRRKAERARAKAESAPESGVIDAGEEEEDEEDSSSKSAAKDANAKFDAYRIAFGLADAELSTMFDRCTLRHRDWAGVTIAYGDLEATRKARVASEQQFRQIHRTELRRLVKDQRVHHATLSDGQGQAIKDLIADYRDALATCGHKEREVAKKLAVLQQAESRIVGARTVEEEMEKALEAALRALPEYSEFLVRLKTMKNGDTGLPLGKYIGERIFGRWIAGFGAPMASRTAEPMRPSDAERIATCRELLSDAIRNFTDRDGLPAQPPPGGGKTREWLLACERLASTPAQTEQVAACRDAYRWLTNARKAAASRPLNRVIAYMGLHVRQGGKYGGTPKDREFPRRRKGGRANWNERLLRQGAYQWGTLIIKGGDSFWKQQVYLPYKERLVAAGETKGRAHKRAFWRMVTVAVRWVISQWFDWERGRAAALPESEEKAA